MNIISTTPESEIQVIKSNGKIELFNPDKIYKYINIACKGTDVQPAQLMMNLDIRLRKKMKSSEIQDTLIKSVVDGIDENNIDNEKVAARLLNQKIRKEVYGQWKPTSFTENVKERVRKKYYDPAILNYSDNEFKTLEKYIKYDRDDLFLYTGLIQETKKLLMRNKQGKNIETPQEAFMLIPMYMFMYSKNRIRKIKKFYDGLSKLEIILSTPIGVGVRTNLRMYSSCAGVMVGDNYKAIAQAFNDMYKLTINRAGIGANNGHIRGLGADIDNGREQHTGLVPILKVQEKISISAMQPGAGRGGAITQYYPFFHAEIMSILELKNNKGTDDNRVRQSDHAIIFNDFFMKRFNNNEDITLFYMNDAKDLYEHIGMDDFEEKYVALENKRGIKKTRISAKEIYSKFWIERFATGRVYKVNANEFQNHSAFKVPVYNSNLCTEINLPSFEHAIYKIKIKKNFKEAMDSLLNDIEISGEWFDLYEHFKYQKSLDYSKENFAVYKSMLAKPKDIKLGNYSDYSFNFYEIFACILAGYNLSKAKSLKDIENTSRQIVQFLDNLIDYQEYPIPAMKKAARKRRALGISISGLFHYLAKKDLDYNTLEARNAVHEAIEALYYGAVTESIKLAKEKGKCHFYNDTKYSDNLLTIDTYNKNVDELVTVPYNYDWDQVRKDLKEYGIRNSTLLTIVPASNSARVVNTISGIEPPQDLVLNIEDKRIMTKMCLPDLKKYKDYYIRNNAWDIDNSEYYKLIAVIQKFMDQSISLNSYYDYSKYDNEMIPYSKILEDDKTAIKFGIKTHYYNRTNSDNEYNDQHKDKEESACKGGCEL